MKLIAVVFGFVTLMILVSCMDENEITFKRYYTAGKLVYQQRCQNCHGANGEGLAALNPPLTDSVYFKQNRNTVPCIVKYGTKGTIVVGHKFFEGVMPATDLSPVEVAEVLTYVQNSFGNKMGTTTSDQAEQYLSACK